MLQPGQKFPELHKTIESDITTNSLKGSSLAGSNFLGRCHRSDRASTKYAGLWVACPPAACFPGPSSDTLVVLLSPRWGLIPRSKDNAWPRLGVLLLLAAPLGCVMAWGNNSLFFSPASYPVSSLNHSTHPSNLH